MATRRANAPPKAARDVAEILDSRLFKALCEPVRIDIVRFLTVEGRSDVGTIAESFTQDTSVISRHLRILHEAGVVRRDKQGRHVFFELDGQRVVEQMEAITAQCRKLLPLCCGNGHR
jgi:DNA-binding transcriptional ArsR family regulator